MTDVQDHDLGPLTASLGFLTRVIQVQINEIVRNAGVFSLSPAKMALLKLVAVNPGIRQVDTARLMVVQESNMANLVKDLIDRGLLTRTREGGRMGLRVTDAGEAEIDRMKLEDVVDRQYAQALSDDEYTLLRELLTRLYRSALPGADG